MTSTATIRPHFQHGTTISLRLSLEQAICPGNCSTSGTRRVRSSLHEVPQTPLPFLILVQATGP